MIRASSGNRQRKAADAFCTARRSARQLVHGHDGGGEQGNSPPGGASATARVRGKRSPRLSGSSVCGARRGWRGQLAADEGGPTTGATPTSENRLTDRDAGLDAGVEGDGGPLTCNPHSWRRRALLASAAAAAPPPPSLSCHIRRRPPRVAPAPAPRKDRCRGGDPGGLPGGGARRARGGSSNDDDRRRV